MQHFSATEFSVTDVYKGYHMCLCKASISGIAKEMPGSNQGDNSTNDEPSDPACI